MTAETIGVATAMEVRESHGSWQRYEEICRDLDEMLDDGYRDHLQAEENVSTHVIQKLQTLGTSAQDRAWPLVESFMMCSHEP